MHLLCAHATWAGQERNHGKTGAVLDEGVGSQVATAGTSGGMDLGKIQMALHLTLVQMNGATLGETAWAAEI